MDARDVRRDLPEAIGKRIAARGKNPFRRKTRYVRSLSRDGEGSKGRGAEYANESNPLNIGSQPSIDTAAARYEFAKTRHRDVKPLDDASATGVPATNVDYDTNWRTYRRRVCYPWGTMSALNGDKARFNRERKRKLARREYSQALRKKLKGHTPPRPTGTQL